MPRILLLSALPLVLAIVAYALFGERRTSPLDALSESMTDDDAKAWVQESFGKTAWVELLTRIGKGDPQWLRISQVLLRHCDAGACGELKSAVGAALKVAPETVLEVFYDVEQACAAPDVSDFDVYEENLEELVERRDKVAAVKNAMLSAQVDACLAQMALGEDEVRRFFGRAP